MGNDQPPLPANDENTMMMIEVPYTLMHKVNELGFADREFCEGKAIDAIQETIEGLDLGRDTTDFSYSIPLDLYRRAQALGYDANVELSVAMANLTASLVTYLESKGGRDE